MIEKIANKLNVELERALTDLPIGMHDSFKYTTTGNNLCHSVTIWLLGNVIASLPGVAYVGVDVRLNRGQGLKFQPDLVGFNKSGQHVVYVDFESPNSSDARVPTKDIHPYLAWAKQDDAAPYVIVTSLPDHQAPEWRLLWTSTGNNGPQYNYAHRNNANKIRENPLKYWTRVWSKELNGYDLSQIVLLDIDGKKVKRVRLS
jgi:hypothetical protein